MRNLIIFLLLLVSCKKDDSAAAKPDPKYACASIWDAEYSYKVYHKGSLDTNITCTINEKIFSNSTVLDVKFIGGREGYRLEIDCVAKTFIISGKPATVGKMYGYDSLVMEEGDYKWVYENRKFW